MIGLDPDITFFLDITPEESNRRVKVERGEETGLDKEKIRKNYLKKSGSHMFFEIDGNKPPSEIETGVWDILTCHTDLLKRKEKT